MPNEQSPINLGETGISEPTAQAKRFRAKRVVLLGLVPIAAVVIAVGYWLHGARYVATENAYVKTDIAKLAAEVSGRALEVRAKAHMKVSKGDTLVIIDPEPFRIAVQRAEAELDSARQEVRTLAVTLKEARTELRDAQDRSVYFRKRFERERQLVKRGVTSHARYDEMENDANAADDRVTMARQKVQRVQASLGSELDQPVDSHPLVRTKLAVLEQARLDLERTTVKAPTDGIVVSVPLVAGEQITKAEPLMAIVTDTPPWVEANFKETELTHVRPGQTAKVTLDIYPDITWDAEVQSISPATGAEFAILPPQNASGNWVKVVQRLPVRLWLLPKADAPPLRAGMTATATVDTQRERSIADLIGIIPAKAKATE